MSQEREMDVLMESDVLTQPEKTFIQFRRCTADARHQDIVLFLALVERLVGELDAIRGPHSDGVRAINQAAAHLQGILRLSDSERHLLAAQLFTLTGNPL